MQSGLFALWWNYAMRHFFFLYNAMLLLTACDGRQVTPYEARFETPFLKQDLFQFGCELEYLPANPDYTAPQHTFGPKERSGIFFGYHQNAGGQWSGDIYVADWEAMANATHPTRIEPTRIRRGNITQSKTANGMFRFPIREGALKLNYIKHRYADADNTHKDSRMASEIQAEDNPTSTQPRLPEEADAEDIATLFNQAGSDPSASTYLDPDGTHPQQSDYWNMPNWDTLIRFHLVPRTKLFLPTEDNCPVPQIGRAHV